MKTVWVLRVTEHGESSVTIYAAKNGAVQGFLECLVVDGDESELDEVDYQMAKNARIPRPGRR